MNEAERVKCEQGVERSPAALSVLDRLGREIVRTVAGFEPLLAGQPVLEGLTLIGGTARLPRIEELLRERTGLGVARLSLPRGEAGSPANALFAGGDPLLYAQATALALRGTLRAKTRLDFGARSSPTASTYVRSAASSSGRRASQGRPCCSARSCSARAHAYEEDDNNSSSVWC